MGQDIREMLKRDNKIPTEYLHEGHRQRFLDRLEKELPVQPERKKPNYGWMKVAASVAVIVSISLTAFFTADGGGTNKNTIVDVKDTDVKNATVVIPKVTSPLAEISPEYEKAENYFLTSIKFELSQINVDDSNKELVESFMKRLENLNNEYQELNNELMEVGPNTQSVEAMMENLRLRLSLLNRLKSKLKELEKIEDENYIDIQA